MSTNFTKKRDFTMKPIRTMSGVTPVAVLTKPFPCPGRCIFCPNDPNMPKSYISSEPGAQRATANHFDPYLQTYNRMLAYENIKHPTDKIELIILGGSWTVYPEKYQVWFIKRCFEAMNVEKVGDVVLRESPIEMESTSVTDVWAELFKEHNKNENAAHRCVGLVVETRPDLITKDEVVRLRKLGVTKVQMGVQFLDDAVLEKNKRGHTVDQVINAFKLLRSAGFKIHVHWMPNLYGSTVQQDIADYKKLFDDVNFRPDEVKVYPCSLIAGTELVEYHEKGLWKPYSEEELLEVLTEVFKATPRYCRITRMVRDIPSEEILVGNKKSNFRQIVEKNLTALNIKSLEIRSREIKNKKVNVDDLVFKTYSYDTSVSKELFFEYTTESDEIAAFLRLSLPFDKSNFPIIREVHVYGQSLNIGEKGDSKAQHSGLGKTLIAKSKEIAKENGFNKLAVISAVGTREYYRKNGFVDGDLYQFANL